VTEPAAVPGLPRAALDAWLGECLGQGWHLAAAQRLTGRSAELYKLIVRRGERIWPVVLRRHNRPDWLARRPDLVTYEATVLRGLAGSGLPAPRLLGVDPAGTHCRAPALLSTWLPGRTMRAIRSPRRIAALARTLRELHALRPPPAIRPYRPWYDTSRLAPPAWSRCPQAWAAAFALVAAGPSAEPSALLHRDFHQQNVLWQAGRVSGIVDWVEASVGPVGADLGHCRRNLAQHGGAAAADLLLRQYGADLHPYWDLVSATDLIHDYADRPDRELDDFVARAVART
jgi:aminoglycoside phosphotransferase (APT) family kinase protein